jgi:hypothetical protein
MDACSYVGGLVGSGGNISDSYATGDVEGTYRVGGLVGSGGNISDSYATGDVEGKEQVGGLVGEFSGLGRFVKHSYSTGAVTGTAGLGGLIGVMLAGAVEDSYYDTETSGRLDDRELGTPKNTEEMSQQATFENWDFTDIWVIDEGTSYPYLRWEIE